MPRKTKETPEIENEAKKKVVKKAESKEKTSSKKTATTKESTTAKKVAEKKETKKATAKSSSTKKTSKKEPLKSSTTKATAENKTSRKKAVSTKKETAKKATTKASAKKLTTKKTSKNMDIVEYYDLPYRYNQTIVKILAQTPTTLFIYWDISDEDRENYKKQFGENFFETTKPVLKIFNDTMNYNFEIEINDFANSWYLHIADSKCDYRVELGRRPIYNPADIGGTDYVYISSSNEIEAPNDKILIDKVQNMVYFRNVKTNQLTGRSFASLSLLRNMGKIYNIYDLYKELYKDENLYNPSSKFF